IILGDQRTRRDERHPCDLQPAQLRRELRERTGPPVDRARVGVVEGPALDRHVTQYVTFETKSMAGPHEGQPVLRAGEPLGQARAWMILFQGRGGGAADIMTIAAEVMFPGVAYLAPQAAGSAWYPYPFTAPLEANEPYLSSALDVLSSLMAEVEMSVPAGRLVLLGFSQGACLALEFAARHARRFGGVVGLSGGLIGPDGTPRDYPGSFELTPVFLGCSDVDPHIPKARVIETGGLFEGMGADLTLRLYPGMGHTVIPDELEAVRAIVEGVAG